MFGSTSGIVGSGIEGVSGISGPGGPVGMSGTLGGFISVIPPYYPRERRATLGARQLAPARFHTGQSEWRKT